MLSNKEFYSAIQLMPLVAFEMLIHHKGKYLMGKRTNEPAMGYLFNTGGRIRKSETIKDACERLTKTELGMCIPFDRFEFYTNTQHMYDNNVFNDETSTHYVCLCYKCELSDEEYSNVNIKDQHSSCYWMTSDEILNNDQVHENSKAYFR